MTRDEFERRIAERIADGYCQIGKAPIEIFEDAKEGQARVTCAFSATGVGLWLRLDKVGFPFLRRQNFADDLGGVDEDHVGDPRGELGGRIGRARVARGGSSTGREVGRHFSGARPLRACGVVP